MMENISMTAWNITIIDIENTLRSSCDMILKDVSVNLDTRDLRA